jgi:hypothetical protein
VYRVLTSRAVKELAAELKRTEPPRLAPVEDTVQIWALTTFAVPKLTRIVTSPILVFEIPRDEVLPEVLEKCGSEPVNVADLLQQVGYAPPYETDWRKVLRRGPGEAVTDVERLSAPIDSEVLEEVLLVKLITKSGEARFMKAGFYDFFCSQLLTPRFELQVGGGWTGLPGSITIWEGDALVGVGAAFLPDGVPGEG